MPLSPNQGSTGGGTAVTITGTNLGSASAVNFGSKEATITANTATSVDVISPSGTGVVEVTVTTPGGTSNPLLFFYVGAPFKTGLSDDCGPTAGGNTVSLFGTGLATATSVSFGANSATPTVVNDGEISVTVPAGAAAGSVGVTVTTLGGSNDGLSYTYVDDPTIGTIDPSSGPTTGGTAVSITGTGFGTTESVTFGGSAAAFSVISDTELSVVTPTGAAGAVDVVVTNCAASATAVGGFTYVSSPSI